jgi:hypothetical protein
MGVPMTTVRMRPPRRWRTVAGVIAVTAAAALLVTAPAAVAAPARQLRYQTVNLPGAITTVPIGINDKGVFTGVYVPEKKPREGVGFIDAHGHVTSFTYPAPDFVTESEGINNRGTVVGFSQHGHSPYQGWLRSPSGRFTPLTDPLAGTGAFQGTFPEGVTDHGVVAGDYFTSRNILHGFVWRAGRFTTVDVPHGFYGKPDWGSGINGINNAGVIVGYYTPSRKNVVVGSVDSAGQVFSFTGPGGGTRPGYFTFAEAISNTGAIAGQGVGPRGVHDGWVLSGFRFTTVKDPNATTAPSKVGDSGTLPYGINRYGVVVGEYFDARHIGRGFLVRTGITGGASLPPPSAPGATGPAPVGGAAGLAPGPRIALLGRLGLPF